MQTNYIQNQPVQAWSVTDLLAAAAGWENVPEIIESYHNEGHLTFHPEAQMIEVELRDGNTFEATQQYVIIYNNGFFDVMLAEAFLQLFTPQDHSKNALPEIWSGAGYVGSEEIQHRFGFHKAAIEGDGATKADHAELRKLFMEFAGWLDQKTPMGREKALAFTKLEEASMWSHKALARLNEPLEDN